MKLHLMPQISIALATPCSSSFGSVWAVPDYFDVGLEAAPREAG
jgi:hypothetical protein